MPDNDPGPLLLRYDGDAFIPVNSYQAGKAARGYYVDETYTMAPLRQRSENSEREYFACLDSAWKNLPESIASQYPTREHLRKKALIQCGYTDEKHVVLSSHVEANQTAFFINGFDDYAITTATGCVVTRYTAKSQSRRAMGRAEFQKSKEAVLDYVAALVGVSVDDMKRNKYSEA